MVVMTLEKVPPSLRGELTRWLIEIRTGVYVGRVSAVVRDLLWERSIARSAGGRVAQVWSSNTEQGFTMRIYGDVRRSVVDFEGIQLVAEKTAAWETMRERGVFSHRRET